MPDLKIILSGSGDRTIKAWNPDDGILICTYHHDAKVTALAELPGGRVAAGDALGRLLLLELKNFRRIP